MNTSSAVDKVGVTWCLSCDVEFGVHGDKGFVLIASSIDCALIIHTQMACWTIIFAKILADHQEDYIAQRGDDQARVQIIKDCWKAILATPQANHPSVMLPDGLQSVSTFDI